MQKIIFWKKLTLVFLVAAFVCFDFRFYIPPADAGEVYDTRKSIDKTEDQIDAAKQQLEQSQSQYQTNQAQINSTRNVIAETQDAIEEKQKQIEDLRQRIELNRRILESYLQEMSFSSSDDLTVTFAASNNFLHEFSGNFDNMISVKEKVLSVIDEISQDKIELSEAKKELDEKKEEKQKYLSGKQAQQVQVAASIQETQLTISQLQAKLTKLRSILSNFLGESFSMDDVIDAVKYADKKTGVRKEFLLAVLDKETDLGRYTGGCNYKESKMGSTNLAYFKDICDDLGYDYKKMKVSCALSYGIGGAMGVAQFMPSTWVGYADAIASKTGNDPANPWSLKDGIMGMALYLKNKGGDSKSGEYQAAAMYYCGGNWKRTVCYNYANTVISWSKGYDDYF